VFVASAGRNRSRNLKVEFLIAFFKGECTMVRKLSGSCFLITCSLLILFLQKLKIARLLAICGTTEVVPFHNVGYGTARCTAGRCKQKLFFEFFFAQLALLGCCLSAASFAQLPTGASVASGSVNVTQNNTTMNVNQSSNSAVINWQSFSIGSTSTVNFNQPSSSAVTLNRVTGNASSVINGVLNSNGNVFLVNSNGILMSSTAKISTGGFVASSLDIADSDFMAGKYLFASSASKPAAVTNSGVIATNRSAGYVALLGGSVSNQGTITANKGVAALAAGNEITLNFSGGALTGVTVSKGALDALVENKQAIYADGGTVILSAKAADSLLSAQVNNTGLIQAHTVDDLTGDITLAADGGTASVGGTLDASAPTSGNGGQINTSGTKVTVADGALVNTQAASGSAGLWSIDSYGFTVAASGGNMTASELHQALNTTSVAINSSTASSNGIDSSVNITAPLSWTGNTTLTLAAADYVNVANSISASGSSASLTMLAGKSLELSAPITLTGGNAALSMTAGKNIDISNAIELSGTNAALSMQYGDGGDYNLLTPASYSGAVSNSSGVPIANTDTSKGTYGSITLGGSNASLNINGSAYTLIHSMSQLDALDGYNAATDTGTTSAVSGNYALTSNLDASGTTYSGSLINAFTGNFAGLGHSISNLTIAATQKNTGLIGTATNATLRDIGLKSVDISSTSTYVGALLGTGTSSTVRGSYSTGQVSAYSIVGGLIGSLSNGSASYDYSSADVTSTEEVPGSISGQSYPNFYTGGLIGISSNSGISHTDATGDVTSYNGYTGGLVGKFSGSSIDLSYATGTVKETTLESSDGGSATGGLVGEAWGDVHNSYATGDVTGYDQVGGLIGLAGIIGSTSDNIVEISNSHATGDVNAYGWEDSSDFWSASGVGAGGLVGSAYNVTISKSYATGNVTSYYDRPYLDQNSSEENGYVGGLVGYINNGNITESYATGNVSITGDFLYGAGGLVGGATLTTVSNSFAYGDVTGADYVGGLIGLLAGSDGTASVTDSAAYGDVSGYNYVGGVVGYVAGNDQYSSASITNVSSYGDVTATGDAAGGIVGYDPNGVIDNASVYGDVQGATNVGSIVGEGNAKVTNSDSYGETTSDATLAELSKTSVSAGAAQTQSVTVVNKKDEDKDQASGTLGDQVKDSILVDDPSRFSATVKTVVVDGVEYQVQAEEAPDDDKQE
jgi:filamentous hemagglutinin family protein